MEDLAGDFFFFFFKLWLRKLLGNINERVPNEILSVNMIDDKIVMKN